MPEVKPNLVMPAGYRPTTVPGLVRAIVDMYAAVALAENIPAPLIQFGRRYIAQINAPSGRILIVPRKGPLGPLAEMGSGCIASILPTIAVYLWGAEPVQTTDEVEDELTRFDFADAMVARFINVLNRVAAGLYELSDLDPDQGVTDPAAVNEYGETYLLTFRFIQDVARDGVVFSVLPTLDASGRPTPKISPPPNYAVAGGKIVDIEINTDPAE